MSRRALLAPIPIADLKKRGLPFVVLVASEWMGPDDLRGESIHFFRKAFLTEVAVSEKGADVEHGDVQPAFP